MRKFNAKLFLILVAAAAVTAGGLFGVHYLQYQRIARALLYQANRAEEQGQTERMAGYLKSYLEFAPHDTAARARLGKAWAGDAFVASPRTRLRGADQLNQVLIKEPDHPDLRKAVIKVALYPNTLRPKMARDHLEALWQDAQKQGEALPAKERGELESLWGQLYEVENKPVEAVAWYRRAREDDPEEPLNYMRLASLLRLQPEGNPGQKARNGEEADALMDALVAANPHSYKAYLARWGYRREFDLLRDPGLPPETAAVIRGLVPAPAADKLLDRRAANEALLNRAAEDVEAALKRAPEEVEVLLAAADMNRLKGSLARDVPTAAEHRKAARAYLQQGLQLQTKAGYRGASEQAKFQLLWHLANLLLDARPAEATASAEAPGPDRQDLEDAAAAITQVRQMRSVPPGTGDYLEGRLFHSQRRWAEAAARLEQARPQLAKQRGQLAFDVDMKLGKCYEKLEEPGQMLAAYERALQFDPNSGEARLGMGAALWAMGRVETAIQHYETALARDQVPGAGWMDIARLRVLVQLQGDKGDRAGWQLAEAALERAEKTAGKYVEVKLLRAEVLAAQGKLEDAEQLLVDALAEAPNEAELWVARAGLAERGRGKVEAARKVLEAAERQLGDRVELRLARARMASHQGRGPATAKALAKLEEGRETFPPADQSKLLDGLAEARYVTGEPAEARRLWEEMARLPTSRDDLRLRLLLFDLAMKEGDEKGVDKTLADIYAVERGQGAYHRFGQALRLIDLAKKGKADKEALNEARLLLDQAANMRPTWSRIALARAEIEELRGNPEEGIAYLKKAIEEGETSPVVIQRLVDALMRRQRYTEAEQELNRLHKSLLVNSELGRMAAGLQTRLGNHDKALVLIGRNVDPDSKNYLDQIMMARMLFAANKDQEAFARFKQAISLAPTEPEPYVALVQFLSGRGRGQEAVGVITDARKALPPEKAPLALAQCYDSVGLAEEARQHFEAAVKQNPGDAGVLRAAAEFYLKTGRLAEVAPLLRAVVDGKVQASPDNVAWAKRGLAVVLAASMDYEQFKEALRLVGLKLDDSGQLAREETSDASTESLRAKARVLATQPGQRQFRERAVEYLELLSRRGSLLPDDRYILALLYDSGNAWPKSREHLKDLALPVTQGQQPRYLAQAPQYMHRYVLGLLRNGDYDEAERVLTRLDSLEQQQGVKEGTFGTVELRAQLWEKTGRGDKAVAMLTEYAARNRDTKDMPLLIVGSLVRQKKFDLALAQLEKDIDACRPESAGAAYVSLLHDMDPTDAQCERAEAWLKKQVAQVEQQMRQKSEPRRAEEQLFRVTVLRQHLASLYDLRGRYPEAEKMYDKVLQDHKTNVLALNNLSWLLAQRGGNREDRTHALELIDRAITNMGRRADLLDTRGVVYLALGEPEKALADFKEAAADERTPTRLFHLARAHFEAKDRATATKILQDAKRAGLEPTKLHPVEQLSCRNLMTELKVQ
jgi:tetratricopeptide (TPR) repeat protein